MNTAIAIFSLIAAGFWVASALVPVPPMFTALGSFAMPEPKLNEKQPKDPLAEAIRRQSRLSAAAAVFAAIAALLQTYVAFTAAS